MLIFSKYKNIFLLKKIDYKLLYSELALKKTKKQAIQLAFLFDI